MKMGRHNPQNLKQLLLPLAKKPLPLPVQIQIQTVEERQLLQRHPRRRRP